MFWSITYVANEHYCDIVYIGVELPAFVGNALHDTSDECFRISSFWPKIISVLALKFWNEEERKIVLCYKVLLWTN